MKNLIFLAIFLLSFESCQSIPSNINKKHLIEYTREDYKIEIQKYFTKDFDKINDSMIEIFYNYYQNKKESYYWDKNEWQYAFEKASIVVKIILLENNKENILYIRSLIDALNGDRKEIKDRIIEKSKEY